MVVADQAISSAGNFSTLLLGAALLDLDGLGHLTIALGLVQTVVATARGRVGESLVLLEATAATLRGSRWSSVGIGLLGILLVGGAALAVEVLRDSSTLVACACIVPVVLLDSVRYGYIASQNFRRLIVIDTVWVLSQGVIISVVVAADWVTPNALLAAWGLGALLAFLFVEMPRPSFPWAGVSSAQQFLSDTKASGRRFAIENLMAIGLFQVYMVGLAAILGTYSVGLIQSVVLPFNVLNVFLLSLRPLLVNEAVRDRLWLSGPWMWMRRCRRTSLLLLGLVGFVVIALAVLPKGLLRMLLGDGWGESWLVVLLPTGMQRAALAASEGPLIGLRVMGEYNSLFRVRALTAILYPVAGLAAATSWGLKASLWSTALVQGGSLIALWILLVAAVRARRMVGPRT